MFHQTCVERRGLAKGNPIHRPCSNKVTTEGDVHYIRSVMLSPFNISLLLSVTFILREYQGVTYSSTRNRRRRLQVQTAASGHNLFSTIYIKLHSRTFCAMFDDARFRVASNILILLCGLIVCPGDEHSASLAFNEQFFSAACALCMRSVDV